MAAAEETEQGPVAGVDEAARRTLRGLANGERLDPMLRRLLTDALMNDNRSDRPDDPRALVSAAARSATQWVGTGLEEREKVLRDLLALADALPPQPKHGPSFPDKVLSLGENLEEAEIPHAFGGALAVGYYGEPRATGDIDINVFIPIAAWPSIREAVASLQIQVDVDDRELKRTDELRFDWGLVPVHLFFASDSLHQQMCEGVREVPFNGRVISLVAPEHLVIRKAILDRPKDWHDIEQILVATDPLDLQEIKSWLERMIGSEDPRMKKLSEVKASLSLD